MCRKFMRFHFYLFILGIGAIYAHDARAQTGSNATIEQITARTFFSGPDTIPLAEKILLTGRDDLILLRKPKNFIVYGGAAYGFTDNVFLSDAVKQSDRYFDAQAGLNWSTVIARRVLAYIGGGVRTRHYDDQEALDYDLLENYAGLNWPSRWGHAKLRYNNAIIFTDNFDTQSLTLSSLAAEFAKPWRVGRGFSVEPFVQGTYTVAEPRDFDAVEGAAGMRANYRLTRNQTVKASAAAYAKNYDDFFPDIFNEARRDRGYRFSAGWSWTPRAFVSADFSVNYTENRSSLAPYDYHANMLTPRVDLKFRF